MGRTPSKYLVTVLDITPLAEHMRNSFIEAGYDMSHITVSTPYNWGIVEAKNGYHYLINSEGCGSGVGLEYSKDEILWYKDYWDNWGKQTGFDAVPTARTLLNYEDILNEVPTRGCLIRLDEFIRTFGDRLDRNYVNWERFLDGEPVNTKLSKGYKTREKSRRIKTEN